MVHGGYLRFTGNANGEWPRLLSRTWTEGLRVFVRIEETKESLFSRVTVGDSPGPGWMEVYRVDGETGA